MPLATSVPPRHAQSSSSSGEHAALRPKTFAPKPALAERSPRLLEVERRIADVFDEFLREKKISNDEWADDLGVSERVVRDLRKREKPLRLSHCCPKNRRRRRQLLERLIEALDTDDPAISA